MPVRRAIYTMAVPTIIAQLINLVYNVVDTFFIGRTGNAYMMAAVSVAYTLYIMNVAFANLFGIGGGSLMARLAGKGENDKAKNVSAYSFFGAIAIAIAYSLLILITADPLLRLLGATDLTIGFAKQYVYTVVVVGNIPIILSATLAHLIRNAGYSKQASMGLSMGGILNIALDPIFMFVLLPDGYEVLGAAIATLLANIIACVYLLFIYRRESKHTSLSMSIKKAKHIEKEQVKELFSVGVPSAILTGLFDLANMFMNAIMASYGETAVAALGIVMKVERLPNAMNIGICQGTMPLIAYNFASGNWKRMNLVIKKSTKYGLIICFFSLALFELLAKPLTGVFLDTNSVQAQGAVETLAFAAAFLRIRCLASPVQFMNYRSSFCMQAMGDGKGTLIHAIVRELVFYIPLMYLLSGLFKVNGLVFSLVIAETLAMILALYLMKKWQKKVLNIK